MRTFFCDTKVRPKQIQKDVCHVSTDLLARRCGAFLHGLGPDRSPWIPDHLFDGTSVAITSTEPSDVFLFGGYISRLFETGNWPERFYRLWVLSPAVRAVLVRQFGIPERYVGVVPRYALFPKPQCARRPLPVSSDEFTLVFSGRISATKNIEFLLRTVHALQTEQGIRCRLVLIGEPDDNYHEDFGRRVHQGFYEHVKALIADLPWRIPPALFPKRPPEKWHEGDFVRPVFISLSTFLGEDYGVSLAQAESLGWPCIVSDWGGHREATGENILKIPPLLIGHSHQSARLISFKASQLARWIRERLGIRALADDRASDLVSDPEPIHALELDRLRRSFLDRMGYSAQLLYREGLASFADTDEGGRFLRTTRSIFSASPPALRKVFVLPENVDGATASRCEKLLGAETDSDFAFLSGSQVREGALLWGLQTAETICIPDFSASYLPLVRLLRRELGFPGRLSLHERDGSNREELKSLLLPVDSIESWAE